MLVPNAHKAAAKMIRVTVAAYHRSTDYTISLMGNRGQRIVGYFDRAFPWNDGMLRLLHRIDNMIRYMKECGFRMPCRDY